MRNSGTFEIMAIEYCFSKSNGQGPVAFVKCLYREVHDGRQGHRKRFTRKLCGAVGLKKDFKSARIDWELQSSPCHYLIDVTLSTACGSQGHNFDGAGIRLIKQYLPHARQKQQ
jgi:hypothetical protein